MYLEGKLAITGLAGLDGWEVSLLYYEPNGRKKIKSVELDILGVKPASIEDQQKNMDLIQFLYLTFQHYQKTILYDELDDCLLLMVKDVLVENQPWTFTRYDGIKSGFPVYSEKKLVFSGIPDGLTSNTDFYVFWNEVNGLLKLDIYKKKQSKFFK